MAAVKIDFSAIGKVQARLRTAGGQRFQAELNKRLGARALQLVAEGFKQQRDPYGNAWAPLKLRKGRILQQTGRLARSATVQVKSSGFEVRLGAPYARTHQRGATIRPRRASVLRWRYGSKWYFAKKVTIPRRQMVPERRTGGWGPTWTAAFKREAQGLLREHFTGLAR